MKTGAAVLGESLRRRGVERAFGLPGTQNVGLLDALRGAGIRTVLASHELAAGFMAVGHHRASGRIAPLVTMPGPGFTWALTALAEARHDSTPLLSLVGAPPGGTRPFRFQDVDQSSIAAPLAKAYVVARDASEVAARLDEALDLALGGEPGPVVLECSPNALDGMADPAPVAPRSSPTVAPEVVRDAALRLAASRRPVLLVGGGCRDAAADVEALATWLRAPVATTTSGRGTVPEDHPLAMGFESARGDIGDLNRLLASADCLLVMGCKLTAAFTGDFRLELPADRMIRVDASPEVLSAGYPASLPVVADIQTFLRALRASLPPESSSAWAAAEVAEWRSTFRRLPAAVEQRAPDLAPPTVSNLVRAIRAAVPRDGIVVTDSGLHQEIVRRHLDVLSPHTLLTPVDFQSMGFGLPAAIGAALAAPERPVLLVIGDGGMAMSGMELLTAVRERANLTVVVMVDGFLNRIRLQQLRQYGRATATRLLNPDFGALAASVGARHVVLAGDPAETLRQVVAAGGVTLVEIRLDDSLAARRSQLAGVARVSARRAAGPRVVQWWRNRRKRR